MLRSKLSKTSFFFTLISLVFLTGCATESHMAIAPETVRTYNTQYVGPRAKLVIGSFVNKSTYGQGLFSSSEDKLGNQARTILKTHLQQTNRFTVLDRQNIDVIKMEAGLSGIAQKIKGARYAVAGDVTEFGRKVTGDHQFFGILGAGKKQVAYAKVSLNIVDVATSEVVYSVQGAGEYQLSNREVLGFGGTASYDSTLNGKVLNFAVTEAVNQMVQDIQSGVWQIDTHQVNQATTDGA